MSTTQSNKTTAVKAKKAPLSRVLDTTDLAEGLEALRALDTKYAIIPATSRETILDQCDSILAAPGGSQLTVGAAIRDQAYLLQTLTGVPASAVHQFQNSETAEALHSHRNLIVTLAVLAVHPLAEVDTGSIYQHAARLQARSHYGRRPFTDDEILLCRVAIHLLAVAPASRERAIAYGLSEAAMAPGETPVATLSDFDDVELPLQVLAAGNGHLDGRYLPLTQWTSHLLGLHLHRAARDGWAPDRSLTYSPRRKQDGNIHEPGSSAATASAQGVLDRFLKELGLFADDVTASSIYLWRVKVELETKGSGAARELSGRRTTQQMYTSLGQFTRPTPEKQRPRRRSFLGDV